MFHVVRDGMADLKGGKNIAKLRDIHAKFACIFDILTVNKRIRHTMKPWEIRKQ